MAKYVYSLDVIEFRVRDGWTIAAEYDRLLQQGVAAATATVAFVGVGCEALCTGAAKDFWMFNPADAEPWSQKAPFPGMERVGGVAFTIGDKFYTGFGQTDDFYQLTYHRDIWEFDPNNGVDGAWRELEPLPSAARLRAVGFAIGDKGYVGLGIFGNGELGDMWEFDPAGNGGLGTWVQMDDFPAGTRVQAVAASDGQKGYIGSGISGVPVTSDFWSFDPAQTAGSQWLQLSNIPGSVRQGAVAFSIGQYIVVGSGRVINEQFLNDFWIYDPSTDQWNSAATLPGDPRWHAVAFAIGDKGYFGTGEDVEGNALADFWQYTPAQ